jgi:uncharacterized protein (DUF1330 family)
MRAFVISLEKLHDPAMLAEYGRTVIATFAPFGGKFVVRSGSLTKMEGEWPYERTAILEFPSREKAEAWYNSAEYQKILPLRVNSTTTNLVIIDGVD